jgi:hypothetical protein
MIETSLVSLAQAFDRAEELEKHAEQKALAATKINVTSVNNTIARRGNKGANKSHKG